MQQTLCHNIHVWPNMSYLISKAQPIYVYATMERGGTDFTATQTLVLGMTPMIVIPHWAMFSC